MNREQLTAKYFYGRYQELHRKSLDCTQTLTDDEWTRLRMYEGMAKYAADMNRAKIDHDHRLAVYISTLPLDTKASMLAYKPK